MLKRIKKTIKSFATGFFIPPLDIVGTVVGGTVGLFFIMGPIAPVVAFLKHALFLDYSWFGVLGMKRFGSETQRLS